MIKKKYALIIIPIITLLLIVIISENAKSEPDPPIISNVSPANNSIHAEIENNPPDGQGYVNLSWTITDGTGGGDLEFYMDIWDGSSWVNRLHLTDQNNGSWYHHEDTFKLTNTTYQWRICAKDGTSGEWTNETYSFRTDAIPDAPFEPNPANNSWVDAGYITLSVNVTHPDYPYVKIYNVSFFEYPSGRLIGYNCSSEGFANGTIVTCNQSFYLPDKGTQYYWYAKCKDDEYWSKNSSIWVINTNYDKNELDTEYYSFGIKIYTLPYTYTDIEINYEYYSFGASIYVKGLYADTELNTEYYTFGAVINVYNIIILSNPYPANGSTNIWISTPIRIDANKSGDASTFSIIFLTNDTHDGSWVEFSNITKVIPPNATIETWWGILEFNKTYYWRVKAINSTGVVQYSPVYNFKTASTDSEINCEYYSFGTKIYTLPYTYTDNELDIEYYSFGAYIKIYYLPQFYNPYPDGTENEPLSILLSIETNKDGGDTYWDYIFLTNDTHDGSFTEIGRRSNIKVNNSIINLSMWLGILDYGKTYYWMVSAYNSTLDVYSNSSIYSFKTILNYEELRVEFYTVGAEVPISPPYPKDPIPANNTEGGKNSINFSIFIYDVFENDTIDKVEFYWLNGTKFGEVTNFNANTRVGVYVENLTNYTWHYWYVRVYDGNWVITSDTWRYKPFNRIPVIDESPENGSSNVAVYRKLVSGEWKRFVRLFWNLTDEDGDGMSFILYVKNSDTGEWVQRWTILDYSVHNGSYYHDEDFFNDTLKTYYWKVWVSDGYNETTQEFYFYTQFFIDFWWIPEYPTTDDIVSFYSITEGADDFRWEFGDTHNRSGINETTHRYYLAGYYNITLCVYNRTNNVWGYLTKELRVDRNVTIKTLSYGIAGYNFFTWHMNKTNSSKLAELLGITNGWIHYYNRSNNNWDGYFINFNAGINSEIYRFDCAVIVVGENISKRINSTDAFIYMETVNLSNGYNIISWIYPSCRNSNEINLENGEWVFKYDTINRTWKGYLKGVGGSIFEIKGYDVVIIYANRVREFEFN